MTLTCVNVIELATKGGFQLTSRCPLCKEDEANLDHLLLHCPSVSGHWVALFSLTGMDWVCPFRVNDLIVGWTTFPIRKKAKNMWKAALSRLFWAIWKERNRVVFDNDNFSLDRLKNSCITYLTSWAYLIYEGEYSIVNLLMCIL